MSNRQGPIKAAVLGVGLGGLTFHIPFILALPELFTLHAVLERNPAGPGGKLAERFGADAAKGVTIYKNYDELLNDSEIELVVISTPSGTHFSLAKLALEAGKHGAFQFTLHIAMALMINENYSTCGQTNHGARGGSMGTWYPCES